MISAKRLVIAVLGVVLSTHLLSAQDLSTYRDFHVGMNLASVATQTAKNPSEAKVIHQRPAVIQEFAWRPRPVYDGSFGPGDFSGSTPAPHASRAKDAVSLVHVY